MVRIDKKLVLLLLLFLSFFSEAQVNRYMVFFNDKVGSLHSTSSPETFLSTRAILRRANQNISIVELDLPVIPAYVEGVRNASSTIKVLYRTKWMNGILVECEEPDVPALQGLPFVSSVEYAAPGNRPIGGGRVRSSNKFKEVAEGAAATDTQLSMLGMDAMHSAGYRGEGMLMAIMDAGFPGADTISFFKHVFDENRFDAATSYDFVSGGSNVFRHHNHGTNVWSTIAAYKNGVFKGGAYKANYMLFVTEDAPTEFRVEEYNWLFAAERADSAGVDVITTSLGYRTFDDPTMNYSAGNMDGQTAVITRSAEIAASKGIVVIASAGNEGGSVPTTIGAPSDGSNVLAIGAVNSARFRVSFSSIGPSADGRIKPDVAAMGGGVSIIQANGSIGTANGTSFSGPLTASLATGLWQEFPELTATQLLDKVRMLGNQYESPDNLIGYGIPDYFNDPPVANNQNATVQVDVPKSILLTGSDIEGHTLAFAVIDQPLHGTLGGNAPNLTYTPSVGYVGSDSFTFLVNDGTTNSNVATVSITVDAVTATDPNLLTNVVSVFPNPTSHDVTVEFSDERYVDQLEWTLIDSRGVVSPLRLSQPAKQKFILNLSDQKPGLYLLRCIQGKRYSVHKILKLE